jgi:hypothetical protein
VLEGVTAFLGLEFDAAVLRHHEAHLAMPDVDRIPLLRYVREPLHRSAVGGWRHYFDEAQAAELHGLLGRTLERLGYGEG